MRAYGSNKGNYRDTTRYGSKYSEQREAARRSLKKRERQVVKTQIKRDS